VTPARQLAAAWRKNPADRLRIEREIAATGRQDEFRDHDGQLVARMTPAIREAINGASGGYMGTSDDRRFWDEMKDPEIVAAAGMGFQREPSTGLIHLGEERRAA
jgi:hypothetical protein